MQQMKEVLEKNSPICSGKVVKMEQTTSQMTGPVSKAETAKITSLNSVNSARHQKRIDRLFLRFSAMYGHVWLSIYKTEAYLDYTKKMWLDALLKFEDKSIEYALQLCLNKYTFPPTLPQFIECCKPYQNAGVFFQKQESMQTSDLSVAQIHIDKIRGILNMKPRNLENVDD